MIKRTGKSAILHRVVESKGILYLAGTTADDVSVGMEDQTRQICKKLDAMLESAGSDKTKLLSAQIFVTDISKKEEMNSAWKEWLPSEVFPSRACIGVASLGTASTLIEIVITAEA